MKDEQLNRILILLASGRVLISEFDEFVETIRSTDREQVTAAFRRVKREISGIRRQRSSAGSLDLQVPTMGATALKETLRLLQSLNISPGEGARAMTRELEKIGVLQEKRPQPFSPKEGFSKWFRRMANDVGPSNLLRAAALVADKQSGTSRSDWSLSDEKGS